MNPARVGLEKMCTHMIILKIFNLLFLNVLFYIRENTGKEDENTIQESTLRLINFACSSSMV